MHPSYVRLETLAELIHVAAIVAETLSDFGLVDLFETEHVLVEKVADISLQLADRLFKLLFLLFALLLTHHHLEQIIII